MTRPVTVHIGLPSAGGAVLQTEYFAKAAGLNYLGRKGGDRHADSVLRNLGLLASDRLDLDALSADFAIRIEGYAQPPLASVDSLSTWKTHSPMELGRRMAAVFGPPRVIFVTRRPADWAIAHYQSRVLAVQRDTFGGLNPWLEKHLSQLRVGSDLAAAEFSKTLDEFCQGSGATEWLVAAYEEFEQDRAAFLRRIDAFVGLDGAFATLADGPAPDLQPPSTVMLNYARVLSLFERERAQFFEIADLIAAAVPEFLQSRHRELRENPKASLTDWIAWFRHAQKQVFKAVDRGDTRLAELIDVFPEAPVREGLLAHLADIEAQETQAMLDRGVDLRPFGYRLAPEAET